MNQSLLTERKTIDYHLGELPFLDGKIDLLDWSRIRVILPGRHQPTDFGAWIYAKRQRKNVTAAFHKDIYHTWLVDPSTRVNGRDIAIKLLLEDLYYKLNTGIRPTTIHAKVYNAYFFIDWCDANHHTFALTDLNSAKNAIFEYSVHLEQKVRTNQLHINSASRHQAGAIYALDIMNSVDDGTIGSHIRKIKENHYAAINTAPPEQSTAKNAIAVYSSVFHRFSDFVLKGEKYPFKLSIPNEKVWVFPSNRILKTKYMTDHLYNSAHCQLIDYENGRLKNYDEVAALSGDNYNTKVRLIGIQERFSLANQDQFCAARVGLAKHAHDSFVMLFIANTGINLSQLIELPSLDTYELGREHHKFRQIKYRANNQVVEFFITATFLPVFDKYLRLRKYILNNEVAPNLFFKRSITGKTIGNISPLCQQFTDKFNRRMKILLGDDARLSKYGYFQPIYRRFFWLI